MIEIYRLIALDLFTVAAQNARGIVLEIPVLMRADLRVSLCVHLPVSTFRSSESARCRARYRFAASIIVRFFSRLSVYKSRKNSRGVRVREGRRCANASLGGRGPLLQEIACGTTHLQRANVTYCVAERESLVACSRRFFPACSRARRADKARAMQPWEERTG